MPNYTKTINLEKPLQTEIYDVDKRNANWDKIDKAIKKDRDDADTHAADPDAHANGIAGNAASATKLKTARSITLGGDIRTIGKTFDGSGDIEFDDIQVIHAKKADEATKAVNDTNGNRIDTTYGPVGYTLEEAFKNGVTNDALLVDITHGLSNINKPCIINNIKTLHNCPPDLAWGVRETCFINTNVVVVRITGLDNNGQTNCIWTNVYNHNIWTGWQKYARTSDILPPIEAANLGNPANWWVKIRGGFIIQGGFYAINSTANKETPFTVAFPIAFSTTCMGICGNDVGSGVFALSFNPISNALFNVWRSDNRPTTFMKYLSIFAKKTGERLTSFVVGIHGATLQELKEKAKSEYSSAIQIEQTAVEWQESLNENYILKDGKLTKHIEPSEVEKRNNKLVALDTNYEKQISNIELEMAKAKAIEDEDLYTELKEEREALMNEYAEKRGEI